MTSTLREQSEVWGEEVTHRKSSHLASSRIAKPAVRSSEARSLRFGTHILHTSAHESIVVPRRWFVLLWMPFIDANRYSLDDRLADRTDKVRDRVARLRESFITGEAVLAGRKCDSMKGGLERI